MIFAYYTEFQSKKKRGSMISLLATFWMSGSILAAGNQTFNPQTNYMVSVHITQQAAK